MKQARLYLGLLLALFSGGLLLLITGSDMTLVDSAARVPAGPAPAAPPAGGAAAFVSEPALPTLSRAIADLPLWEPELAVDREVNPRASLYAPLNPDYRPVAAPDPLLPLQLAAPAPSDAGFLMPLLNVPGREFTFANPPDTVGDVGSDHYVQTVNAGGRGAVVTIYDKSNGALVAGPIDMDALSSGGPCATGQGDAIVLYDDFAGRWLMSEVAGAYVLCVYISQTSDAVTTNWYAYTFTTPQYPDYPEYGVWPDAYYVTASEVGASHVYALDRAAMLAGAAATLQLQPAPDLAGFGFQAYTPADADGELPPPVGAPNYVMRHRDDEVHNVGSNNPNADYLEIWEFHVDWDTPANTTLLKVADIPVAEFDSDICGLRTLYGVPMPGVPKCDPSSLDSLREVLMRRLQYRNFGSHETLVGNLTTDVTGNDDVGVRWFELRKTGAAPWALYQEGTYAPDGDGRWMASVAMDGSGNIALAYSVSSASTFPSIRYAGRLAGDPLGTLPQGEVSIAVGAAAHSTNRYGDYSALSVDPEDNCTFWLTNMYNPTPRWATRIAAMRFDACRPTRFTFLPVAFAGP